MARQLMTKAVNMSNPSSSLTESPKESFGDAQTDFLDGCNRAISHISPKMMQRKRRYNMDMLAKGMRPHTMGESG